MTETSVHEQARLAHFPISFFAMVMGLSGLTIAWEKLQAMLGLSWGLTPWMASATGLVFCVLLAFYFIKLLLHRQAVISELRHPIKLNFFPTISISLVLLAVAWYHLLPDLSRGLWIAGAGLHLAFMLYVVGVWIHHEHLQIHHMNPAWFIPAVGNVLVPIIGVPLGYLQVSWFFFSIGMLFWLILLVIIFYRVLFHQPIAARLMPTLFILIAPPAVGFISYERLTGSLDSFALVLYFVALFFTLLLATQAGRFLRLRFFLSWWAYSFPLAAFSIASMLMHEQTGDSFYRYLGAGMVTMLTGIVALLLIATARAVIGQRICQPE